MSIKQSNIKSWISPNIPQFGLTEKTTVEKVNHWIQKRLYKTGDLVAFGEALIPGYPF
ncbi:MAG: hypothetical protein R2750_11645 [Bacteroidales bacterium]